MRNNDVKSIMSRFNDVKDHIFYFVAYFSLIWMKIIFDFAIHSVKLVIAEKKHKIKIAHRLPLLQIADQQIF